MPQTPTKRIFLPESAVMGVATMEAAAVALRIEGKNVVETVISDSLIVGRSDVATQVDVDLTPYEAFRKGISRKHVQLELVENAVVAKDMGSRNGSKLNGIKMQPMKAYPVTNGDTLLLGSLIMTVNIGG